MNRMRTLAAITAALTLLAVLVITSPAAGALVQPTVTLYSGQITVHTHNGKAWHYGVDVYPTGDGSTDEFRQTILRSQSKPVQTTEDHEWFDTIPISSLAFDNTSGKGTLKTPPSVAALTTLNLKFTTTSRHDRTCSSGSETDYFGNLSGQATLHTQLQPGGTVGARHVSFPAGKTEIIYDTDCQNGVRIGGCSTGTSYEADGGGLHSLFGFGPHGFAELGHDVALKNPAGASRQDHFSTNSAHAPVFNARKHILQIWAADSGPFTGTGRFFGGTLSKEAGNCSHKGVGRTEFYRVFENPTFRNGANHPLIAHTNLVGKMGEPKTTHGYYEFYHWS